MAGDEVSNTFFGKKFEIESSSESEADQNVICFICDEQFSDDALDGVICCAHLHLKLRNLM